MVFRREREIVSRCWRALESAELSAKGQNLSPGAHMYTFPNVDLKAQH